jgi:integrase
VTLHGETMSSLAPSTIRWANSELDRFQRWCAQLEIAPETDAVLLYLTALLRNERLNGSQLRRRLRHLDVAFMLDGRPAPSRDRHLRALLRGLHQEAALGPVEDRTPLYREDVAAMLEAIRADNGPQLRAVALLYLANATGMTANALRRLSWNDVRFRRDTLDIQIHARGNGYGPSGLMRLQRDQHPATVTSLKDLRRNTGPVPGPVFAVQDRQIPTLGVLKPVLDLLPARDGVWSWSTTRHEADADLEGRAAGLRQLRPRQLRDAALLSLAFHACLESTEARALQRRHIRRVEAGLLLDIPGRSRTTAVPSTRHRHDPCEAWKSWDTHLQQLGRDSSAWAFPAIVNGVVMNTGRCMTEGQLSRTTRLWTSAAFLQGHYSFASLRIGFMRTAAREGVPEYMILNQAGLAVLKSVELHVHREHLIRHSVVNLLGL